MGHVGNSYRCRTIQGIHFLIVKTTFTIAARTSDGAVTDPTLSFEFFVHSRAFTMLTLPRAKAGMAVFPFPLLGGGS